MNQSKPSPLSATDLLFAESYLAYQAANGHTPESRARAQLMRAALVVLDTHRPGWRADLVAVANEAGVDARALFDFSALETQASKLYEQLVANLASQIKSKE